MDAPDPPDLFLSVGTFGKGVPEDTEDDCSVPSIGGCFVANVVSVMGVGEVKVTITFLVPEVTVSVTSGLGLTTLLDCPPFPFFFFTLVGEGTGEHTFSP